MKPVDSISVKKIMSSPPTRGRGLKPSKEEILARAHAVAPHAGAWVETLAAILASFLGYVAPHAGAWVETTVPGPTGPTGPTSPPTRGRGLKLLSAATLPLTGCRPPRGGVG